MKLVLPQKTQEMIDGIIATLPEHFQVTFEKFDWQGELIKISTKHGLNNSQAKRLIVETALVLFNINSPVTFVQEIENQTGVSENIAENIAQDIVDRVIYPLQKIMREEHREDIAFMQAEVSRLRQEEGHEASFQDLGIELGVLEAGDVILDDSQVSAPGNNQMYNQLMSQRAPLTEVDTRGVRSVDGMTQRVAHVAGLAAANQPPIAPSGTLQDAMAGHQSPAQMPVNRSLEHEVDHLFGSNSSQASVPNSIPDGVPVQGVVPPVYESKDPYHEIIDNADDDDPAANWS